MPKNRSTSSSSSSYVSFRKGAILILRYPAGQHAMMNRDLDVISNTVDGTIVGRIGHNFPVTHIGIDHPLYSILQSSDRYVIAYCGHDRDTLTHELLHAKYYLDARYRKRIQYEWEQLSPKKRDRVIEIFRQIGYQESVWIDEWQAGSCPRATDKVS